MWLCVVVRGGGGGGGGGAGTGGVFSVSLNVLLPLINVELLISTYVDERNVLGKVSEIYTC